MWERYPRPLRGRDGSVRNRIQTIFPRESNNQLFRQCRAIAKARRPIVHVAASKIQIASGEWNGLRLLMSHGRAHSLDIHGSRACKDDTGKAIEGITSCQERCLHALLALARALAAYNWKDAR